MTSSYGGAIDSETKPQKDFLYLLRIISTSHIIVILHNQLNARFTMILCPSCSKTYVASPTERNGPVSGLCGHTMCRDCIVNLQVETRAKKNRRNIVNLQCPFCNAKKSFRVDRMAPNWPVIDMIKKKGLSNLDDSVNGTTSKLRNKLQTKCSLLKQKEADLERAQASNVACNKEIRSLSLRNAKLEASLEALKAKTMNTLKRTLEQVCAAQKCAASVGDKVKDTESARLIKRKQEEFELEHSTVMKKPRSSRRRCSSGDRHDATKKRHSSLLKSSCRTQLDYQNTFT